MITKKPPEKIKKKTEVSFSILAFRLLYKAKRQKEKFSVKIDLESSNSFWNWKDRKIQVGVKDFMPPEEFQNFWQLLLVHEVGHILWTPEVNFKEEGIDMPFSIFNIEEDFYLEGRWIKEKGYDFSSLNSSLYQRYYVSRYKEEKDIFESPMNVLLLEYWARQGLNIQYAIPQKLTDKQTYEEEWDIVEKFLKAVDSFYKDVEIMEDSFKRLDRCIEFFEEWRWLFEGEQNCQGLKEEGSGEQIQGESQVEGSSSGSSQEDGPSEENEPSDGMSQEKEEIPRGWIKRKKYQFDESLVSSLKKQMQRFFKASVKPRVEYRYAGGRKINPVRADKDLPPVKNEELEIEEVHLPKTLLVVDSSGSMSGFPYKSAIHIVRAMKELFPSQVDIAIVSTSSSDPIVIRRVKDLHLLEEYFQGRGENYRSIKSLVSGYKNIIFLSDACISDSDVNFLLSLKDKKTFGLYVGTDEAEMFLKSNFRNYFRANSIDEVPKRISQWIKRNMIKK